jgi:hypothetical protein
MHRRRVLVGAAAVALVAVTAVAWVVRSGDGSEVVAGSTTSTTTTVATTTTTTLASTTTTAPTTTTTSAPTTTTTRRPTTTEPPPVTTTAPPPPISGGDRSVYVLGDSVLLGATTTVPAALAGWIVTMDTVGSRRLPQGIETLRANRSQIGAVVVIQQGNNYIEGEDGTFASQIDEAMRVLAGVKRVVWLTVAEKWPSRVTINQAIRAAPSRWPTAVVGDWAAMVKAHPEYAYDQLHLTPAGRIAIANLIASKVGPAPKA